MSLLAGATAVSAAEVALVLTFSCLFSFFFFFLRPIIANVAALLFLVAGYVSCTLARTPGASNFVYLPFW